MDVYTLDKQLRVTGQQKYTFEGNSNLHFKMVMPKPVNITVCSHKSHLEKSEADGLISWQSSAKETNSLWQEDGSLY